MKRMARNLRLLARNIDKRLLIGIGTELLLKAVYLKHGFSVNKLAKRTTGAPKFPFTFQQVQGIKQAADKTYMLNDLIQKLSSESIVSKVGASEKGLEKGLKIAKVFRNKEGHGVVAKHRFDSTNYRDIERALIDMYFRAFNETLQVHFSLEPHEKGVWRVK